MLDIDITWYQRGTGRWEIKRGKDVVWTWDFHGELSASSPRLPQPILVICRRGINVAILNSTSRHPHVFFFHVPVPR